MDYDKERREEMIDSIKADRELQRMGLPILAIVTVGIALAFAVLFAVCFILIIGFSFGN